jgi:hypothetical protein
VFLTLSVAVPIVFPLTLSVKTTLHVPDALPHVTVYDLPDPATVAIFLDEHVASLKLKTPPFGPAVVTVAFGLDHNKLTEHGLTETPLSFLHTASIPSAKRCICETFGGITGADPAPAQPASRPATARAANGRTKDRTSFMSVFPFHGNRLIIVAQGEKTLKDGA